MKSSQTCPRFTWSLLLCTLAPACVLAAKPIAETGITDDFSYIRTAQVLAQTGHFALNGWATTMVGFQVLPALLFIKLFGFSFTVVRATTLLCAMLTSFLLHRCMTLVGISSWNAAAGTLTVVLSPLFLGMTFTFLTDIWCLFAIIFCLYCCLRSVLSKEDWVAGAWIAAAALGNAALGTVRQVAFLGVLVMVPSTLWLIRKRRSAVVIGGSACLVGYTAVLFALHWFAHAPYSVGLPMPPRPFAALLPSLPNSIVRPALEVPMLLLPLLLGFIPYLLKRSRGVLLSCIAGALILVPAGARIESHHDIAKWMAPFVVRVGSVVSSHGLLTTWPVVRELNPVWPAFGLPLLLRGVLTIGVLAGIAGLAASLLDRRQSSAEQGHSWYATLVVVGPFCIAYVVALIPTGVANATLDRYLLPLVATGALLIVKYYQEFIASRVPVFTYALVVMICAYSVLAVHDLFSMYRAVLTATQELQSAGLPRTAIDAGFEYNGWTQILEGGYVQQDRVRLPPGAVLDQSISDNVCPIQDFNWLPKIKPEYSLSLNQNDCGGSADFAPVIWQRWLRPHSVLVYIVRNPVVTGSHICWLEHFFRDPFTGEIRVAGCQNP